MPGEALRARVRAHCARGLVAGLSVGSGSPLGTGPPVSGPGAGTTCTGRALRLRRRSASPSGQGDTATAATPAPAAATSRVLVRRQAAPRSRSCQLIDRPLVCAPCVQHVRFSIADRPYPDLALRLRPSRTRMSRE